MSHETLVLTLTLVINIRLSPYSGFRKTVLILRI